MNDGSATIGDGIARWAAALATPPELVATVGGGAHIDALLERWPSAAVLTWGRPPAGQAASPRSIARPERARFQAALRRGLAAGLTVARFIPPTATHEQRPALAEAQRIIEAARLSAQIDAATIAKVGRRWFEQTLDNLPTIATVPSLGRLGAAWRGRPILVVGAGPSLDAIVNDLARDRERYYLLAATSALRPLWRQGVIPDAAAIIEARPCAHHVEDVPVSVLQQITLIAAAQTEPSHLRWGWRQRVTFQGPASRWLRPWTGHGSSIPTAGNVGTAMLVIAWMLGGYPVMAAGLDFALREARYYTHGAGSRASEHEGSPTIAVPSWDGAPVPATPELISYREGTELVLREIARVDPRARFLAVGEGGAKVAGMQQIAWSRLIGELPAFERSVGRVALADAAAIPAAGNDAIAALKRSVATLQEELAPMLNHPAGPRLGLVAAIDPSQTAELLLLTALLGGPGDPHGWLAQWWERAHQQLPPVLAAVGSGVTGRS